jgi:hypothetical protein
MADAIDIIAADAATGTVSSTGSRRSRA